MTDEGVYGTYSLERKENWHIELELHPVKF